VIAFEEEWRVVRRHRGVSVEMVSGHVRVKELAGGGGDVVEARDAEVMEVLTRSAGREGRLSSQAAAGYNRSRVVLSLPSGLFSWQQRRCRRSESGEASGSREREAGLLAALDDDVVGGWPACHVHGLSQDKAAEVLGVASGSREREAVAMTADEAYDVMKGLMPLSLSRRVATSAPTAAVRSAWLMSVLRVAAASAARVHAVFVRASARRVEVARAADGSEAMCRMCGWRPVAAGRGPTGLCGACYQRDYQARRAQRESGVAVADE
jgi:hypothetical protein